MLAFLKDIFLSEIERFAGRSERLTGDVEKRDGNQAAGFDHFVGAAIDQFVEHKLESLGRNGPAETKPSDESAEGVGDILGAVTKIRFSRFFDAQVFLDLPAGDEEPG